MEMSLEGMTLEMPMNVEGDFQPPGNTRMLTSMGFLGEALVVQTIGIGDDVYVWDPGIEEWRYEAESELPPFISSGSQRNNFV